MLSLSQRLACVFLWYLNNVVIRESRSTRSPGMAAGDVGMSAVFVKCVQKCRQNFSKIFDQFWRPQWGELWHWLASGIRLTCSNMITELLWIKLAYFSYQNIFAQLLFQRKKWSTRPCFLAPETQSSRLKFLIKEYNSSRLLFLKMINFENYLFSNRTTHVR